jgi:hypothetical protein
MQDTETPTTAVASSEVHGPEQRSVRRIARNIALLAVVAPVVAALLGSSGRMIAGVAVGALLAAGNFLAIERISAKVVHGSVRTQGILMGLLVLKMSALMVVVYVIIRTFGIDAIGFVIGLSTMVAGILVEGLRTGLATERA